MKILQLIDTLNPGGAERMALNYFYALRKAGIHSYLVATRGLGVLGEEIQDDPNFCFVRKMHTFDLMSLWRFKSFLKKNQIEVVQAHGSSWFFAYLAKISGSRFKLVWHDHYGNSDFLEKRKIQPLKILSSHFDAVISVNQNLINWAKIKLGFKKNTICLPNFVVKISERDISLKGSKEIKIISTANLRAQKDYDNLFSAFRRVQQSYSVSLHLFGKNFHDPYSKKILNEISLMDDVYYYGEVPDIFPYLASANLGVLSSRSEGLPLALLEYGLSELPVVCTDVGDCREVTAQFAKLVPAQKPEMLAKAIIAYIQDEKNRILDASNLKKRVEELYSEKVVISQYLKFIEEI